MHFCLLGHPNCNNKVAECIIFTQNACKLNVFGLLPLIFAYVHVTSVLLVVERQSIQFKYHWIKYR